MKKTACLIITLVLFALTLVSCAEQGNAYEMLTEFITVYGAEGVIYSPDITEGHKGYVSEGLMEKAFVFSGRFPDNYAVFLNSHTDKPSECGIFISDNAETLASVEETCLERVRLLGGGFVKRRGNTVYYSTMQDSERAERIFNEIIR